MARIIVNTHSDRFGIITSFGWENDDVETTRNGVVRTIAHESFPALVGNSDLILNGEHRRLQPVARKMLEDILDSSPIED